jgi:cyclohexanecarboxylate-CoA ligase
MTKVQPTHPPDPRYASDGTWEHRTIASFQAQRRRDDPDALAVVDHDLALSQEELGRYADGVARGLVAAGVRAGDVVLVQLPNWWETLVTFHAVVQLGAVVCPVVPIYRAAELGFILRQARPRVVVTAGDFRNFDHAGMFLELSLELPADERPALVTVRAGRAVAGAAAFDDWTPVPEPGADGAAPDDIALLMYTSGTTSSPKGVLHSHQTLVYECRSIADLDELGASDHVFMGSPLTHVTGFLYGFILPAMVGSTVVLLDVWEPAVAVDLIEASACRFTVAATPFLQGLTDEYTRRGHASSLRMFACGGADVPPDLVRRATDVLATKVFRVYGSTEFPTYSFGFPSEPVEKCAETDGAPVGPVVGRIDEPVDGVGELLVGGPELFLGYLDAELNAESFTADGLFRTGDLASFDHDGYVRIHGRKKDIIIRKGENISARELEDILITHPDIEDIAVVAVPDPASGERACAVVVVRAGATVDLVTITDCLAATRIAKQKYPEQLELVGELPRTASGKVQKFLLRQKLTDAAR